jgi:putative hydrolase of the HAD superfamily
LGMAGARRQRLGLLLRDARRLSDAELWTSLVPGSASALLALSQTGVGVAFVSNSDGTAERKLRRLGICQVGPGDGVEVAAIIDSTVVGVAKPDPAIFDFALQALGVDRQRTVYVGDSRVYDVEGARAAGIIPIHFDPFGVCADPSDHAHVGDLTAVVDMVTQVSDVDSAA